MMTFHNSKSGPVCSLLTGLFLGAAAMYFLDPQTGKRRRALVRDQVTHATSVVKEVGQAQTKDFAQRATGMWSTLTSPLRRHDNSDRAINARIRTRLGRLVQHPEAIDTAVVNGCAALRGTVLPDELDRVLDAVRQVAGVKVVDHRLTFADQGSSNARATEQPESTARYLGEMG